MKIALLNLPVDNNYGGHLQRYALMEVLKQMGCDVVHLNTRFPYEKQSKKKQIKFAVKRFLRYFLFKITKKEEVPEIRNLSCFLNGDHITECFYNRYVKHTKRIYDKKDLTRYLDFDMFLVGSDQVWRYKYTNHLYGIDTYFFDYLPKQLPRIAYGVSFGTEDNELKEQDVFALAKLYEKFDAVSVRECSAIGLLEQYGWINPKANLVLDPTFLLDAKHYCRLIDSSRTKALEGNLFCYILDENCEKKELIDSFSSTHSMKPFYISITNNQSSIEQWLRCFRDAEYIITDSYHGLVFSTIFNKPFFLFRNRSRGDARFDSLIDVLYKGTDFENPDWKVVNSNVKHYKDASFEFLNNSLSKVV